MRRLIPIEPQNVHALSCSGHGAPSDCTNELNTGDGCAASPLYRTCRLRGYSSFCRACFPHACHMSLATRNSFGHVPVAALKKSAACCSNCLSSRTCSVPGCCAFFVQLPALSTCCALFCMWSASRLLALQRVLLPAIRPSDRCCVPKQVHMQGHGSPPSLLPATTLAPDLMHLALRRRMRLPLPLTRARCGGGGAPGCRALVDNLGDHALACPRTGLLARRGFVLERAWIEVVREAIGPEGRVVPQQWLANTTAPAVAADDRWARCWWGALAVAVQRAACSAVLGVWTMPPLPAADSDLPLAEVLQYAADTAPSRLPLRCGPEA